MFCAQGKSNRFASLTVEMKTKLNTAELEIFVRQKKLQLHSTFILHKLFADLKSTVGVKHET